MLRHSGFLGSILLTVLLSAAPASFAQFPDFMHACPAQIAHLPQETEKTLDSIVMVQNGSELGSGILISPDGYLLSAAHVVLSAPQVAVHLRTGESVTGQVLRTDFDRDIALIKIPKSPKISKLPGAQYACRPLQPSLPKTGMPVYSIGIVLDTHRLMYQVTPASIVADPDSVNPNRLRTDADLPPGHSGGPLLNTQGDVVGLVSWKSHRIPQETTYSYGASVAAIHDFLKP